MAALGNGGFTVSWESINSLGGSGYDIVAQQFDATGNRVDGIFIVNSVMTNTQIEPDLVGLNGNNFVVSWSGYDGERSTDNTYGIFHRVFGTAGSISDSAAPVLTLLVALGGLVFNIGNIAGCGLGIQTLFGWDLRAGCIGSAAVAIALFLVKDAGKAMDVFTKWLGLGMIALTLLAAYWAQPPLGEVAYRTFFPEQVSEFALLTIVGGTVGGYISFAGAHRLLAAGIQGPEQVGAVSGHAVRGIVLASVMRIVLFLAALGVVTQGVALDAGNPALSVFTTAAGHWGRVFFGIVFSIAYNSD